MATLVSSAFTGANGTNLEGFATDTGQTWDVIDGALKITSNQAEGNSGVNYNVAVVEAGQSDVDVSVALNAAGSGNYMRVVVRATDASNFIFAMVRNDGQLYMYRKQAGAFTELARTTLATLGLTYADGTIFKVTCSGDAIAAYYGATQVMTATQSFNATATKHGISLAFTGARVDDFLVEGADGAPTGTPGSTDVATQQSIYTTGSADNATDQTIYSTATAECATQQTVYSTTSTDAATEQSIYTTGSSTWATQQTISVYAEVLSTAEITGEYDLTQSIQGEIPAAEAIRGQIDLAQSITGVIGVAIENSEITIYRGNSKDIRDTVTNADSTAADLSGATVTFELKKRRTDDTALVTKTSSSGITVSTPSSGIFVVNLLDADTDLAPGRYFYSAKVTDALGKTTTVSTGDIVIKA